MIRRRPSTLFHTGCLRAESFRRRAFRLASARTAPILVLLLSLSSTGIPAPAADGSPTRPVDDIPDSLRSEYQALSKRLVAEGLRDCRSYALLAELAREAPLRLSGSAGAERAVSLTAAMMRRLGFERVRVESVMVSHWERGPVEEAVVLAEHGQAEIRLDACALGGSVGTGADGVTGPVIEVKSLQEVKSLGARARGAIIFFNRPMDPTHLNTFQGYGGAVDQRSGGAIEAARAGAAGVIVRSVTLARDDVPHTGSMSYADSVTRIPALAVSTMDADSLSQLLKTEGVVRLRMRLSARTLPDAPSGNVLGELVGSEKPDEIVVVGGHLDSWDKGHGAHDDGGGCMQAIETLDLLKRVGFKPKRTIRAVMFMNEENGLRGGRAYPKAPARASERHVAAIEADRGAFAPRGLSVDADTATVLRLSRWAPLFAELGAGRIVKGGSGVDIGPLVSTGVPGIGLVVEDHRYFDHHHSANDTIDAVHPRELEMGAIVMALLAAILANQ